MSESNLDYEIALALSRDEAAEEIANNKRKRDYISYIDDDSDIEEININQTIDNDWNQIREQQDKEFEESRMYDKMIQNNSNNNDNSNNNTDTNNSDNIINEIVNNINESKIQTISEETPTTLPTNKTERAKMIADSFDKLLNK